MTGALFFAILAGVSVAAYTIFQKLGSSEIDSVLGAVVIAATAFLVNSIVLLAMKFKNREILFTTKGLWLLVLVGLAAAAGVDLFSLLAYSRGLKTASSPIISGIGASLVLLLGFVVLRESFSLIRLLALSLVITGILLLQRLGV